MSVAAADILRAFCAGEKLSAPTGRERIRMLLEENRKDVVDDEDALRVAYSWYGDLLRQQHQCYTCSAMYTEADNVGLQKCSVHTGQYLSAWSCCGRQTKEAVGCMKQDHAEGTLAAAVLVPRFALPWLADWQRRRICPMHSDAVFLCIANPGAHDLSEAELALWRTMALCIARQ